MSITALDSRKSICLMTVTTDNYLPGTITMLGSFLACNPWFDGDIRIIATELADQNVQKLQRLFPKAQIVPPSNELTAALTQADSAANVTPTRFARFASLDAFASSTWDKLLFCDSDLLFLGDIQPCLADAAEFIVTPDGPNLRGNSRRRDSFEEQSGPSTEPVISNTFNAGFMVIGKSLRTGATYHQLLKGMDSEFWHTIGTQHTDQAVLNLYLEGQQTLIGSEYNYLLGHARDTKTPYDQVKVFHFIGSRKPWEDSQAPLVSDSSEAGVFATKEWHAAHRRVDPEPVFYGARTDMPNTIKRHLFLLCPNNSGSTFLSKAIGTSPEVWGLYREGQHMLGFAAPSRKYKMALLWAASPEALQNIANPAEFDWEQNKKCWYFQALAGSPDASVFFTKSPPFLAYSEMLLENFENTRFLIMVRNPYAVVEAIFRHRSKVVPDAASLLTMAANHIIACFKLQRQNQKRYKDISVFFTYEEMCAAPKETADKIRSLVPEINTLQLDQRLFIKNNYNERLRNMNMDQINRLTPEHLQVINQVFTAERDLLAHFGYDMIGVV